MNLNDLQTAADLAEELAAVRFAIERAYAADADASLNIDNAIYIGVQIGGRGGVSAPIPQHLRDTYLSNARSFLAEIEATICSKLVALGVDPQEILQEQSDAADVGAAAAEAEGIH